MVLSTIFEVVKILDELSQLRLITKESTIRQRKSHIILVVTIYCNRLHILNS